MKKILFILFAAFMIRVVSAAGSFYFGGFGATSEILGLDAVPEHYVLYAIVEDQTSADALSKRFATVGFADFLKETEANALNSTPSVYESDVTLDGLFVDGISRETYLDDGGVSHGLYAVVVHNNTQFKVMEDTFRVPPAGYLVFSGGSWASFAVPEPTSALLLLLGVAGLSLRRREIVHRAQ